MSLKSVHPRYGRWLYFSIGSACLVIFAFLLFLHDFIVLEPAKCYRTVAMEVVFPDSNPKLFLPKDETRLLNWSCLDCGEDQKVPGTTCLSECPIPEKPEPIDQNELNAIHPVLHLHRQNGKIYYYSYDWQGGYKYYHPALLGDKWSSAQPVPQINLRPCDWHICPEGKLDKILESFRKYSSPDSNYVVSFSFGEGSTYADYVESMDWMNILKTRRYFPRDLTELEKNSLPIRGI